MGTATGLFPLGDTFYGAAGTIPTTYGGESLGIEGMSVVKPDTYAGVVRSAKDREFLIMRNVSGSTVYAGYVVAVGATGVPRKRFSEMVTLEAQKDVVGVVDENLGSTGCRDGDLCYVCVRGPTLARLSRATADIAADIAVGDKLWAATAVTTGATTAGRLKTVPASFTITQTTDLTALSYATNVVAKAVSAANSTSTGSLLLVEVKGF